MPRRKQSDPNFRVSLRHHLALTQSEFATMLGLSRDVLQNVELGRSRAPQTKAMLKWAALETVFSKAAPKVPEQWYDEKRAKAELDKWRSRQLALWTWKLDESKRALEQMEAVYQASLHALGHLSRIAAGEPHSVLGRSLEKLVRHRHTKRLKANSLLHQEKLRIQIAVIQAQVKALGEVG
ncbi:MAG: hypothetical protein ACK5XV_12460 [Flavobacteriales bacterium]|jgi:transcriptional regulator with XRE-family HTH domain